MHSVINKTLNITFRGKYLYSNLPASASDCIQIWELDLNYADSCEETSVLDCPPMMHPFVWEEEVLPGTKRRSRRWSVHKEPMMNYTVEGLISFLSAYRTLGDEQRLMGAVIWHGVVYLDAAYLAEVQRGSERGAGKATPSTHFNGVFSKTSFFPSNWVISWNSAGEIL